MYGQVLLRDYPAGTHQRDKASPTQMTWLGYAPYVLYGVNNIGLVPLDAPQSVHLKS